MSTTVASDPSPDDLQERVARFQAIRERILEQVRKVIVGQDEVLEQILIALFVGGHCLITGLPGTAKTLMVRTIAKTLGLQFRRIQFTPDLMPADITGDRHHRGGCGNRASALDLCAGADLRQCRVGG